MNESKRAPDTAAWLERLGLSQYAGAFADNHIDGDMLSRLGADDLKELGVASVGHRKRLLAAIAELGGRAPAPTTPAASDADGERRQVTILFADLCGFTALSQTMDAEDLHALVSRYAALVDGIVQGYGGTIDKHIGDAVMALFGAPVAHGDDTLRSARAALDIHAGMARLGQAWGCDLAAHIGIASGEVVAGELAGAGRREYTVLGDSVNLAARLAARALPGQTLVSDPVYRGLVDRARVDALGETRLKGFDHPVAVWALRDLADDRASSATRFVGRQREIEQFIAMLDACSRSRTGQVVLLRGDAGIGKSRLLGEMLRAAREHGFAAQRTLIFDFGTAKGQDAIRALAAELLGLPAGATQDQRREAHKRALDHGLVASEQGVFLADLIDLAASADARALYDAMDNERRNLGKRQTLTALVANASGGNPRVVAVEDVHWADGLTLQQLAGIAAAMRRVPALLVLTTRVEGDPLDGSWRMSAGGTPLMTIDLGPLPPEEAAALAGTFTVAAARSVASACIERAQGNPLFLEQLLRHAAEGADADAIPASIQSLVLARMDRLGPADKRALLAAAILGQRFDIAPLRHLLGDASYECSALIAHALVIPEQSGFLFAHALVQEGVYSSLLKPRKRELHRRAAEWFGDSDPVLRARHLDRAEDPGAPLALAAAARSERAAFRYEAAVELVDRGLAVVADIGERFELSCLRGELLRDLGSIPESIAAFRNALEIASGDAQRCRAAIGLVEGLRVSEGLAEAQVLLDQAQQAATRDGATAELARIHHLRGNIYFPLGRIDECRAEHEMGLRYALESGSPEAEARALDGLGDAAYAQGRMRSAYRYFGRCAELARTHGFGRIEVATRSMAGCRMYFNEARETLKEGIEAAAAAARLGHLRAELLGRTTCMQACLELGDWDGAQEHLAHANRLAKRLGAKRFEAQNLEFEARILHGRGDRDKARTRLSEALAICQSVGTQFVGPKCIGALALTTDDPVEQRRLLDEGESMLGRGAVSHNHLYFYRDAIEVMLEQERWDDALRYAAALENYASGEPLPWTDLFVERAKALASWATGKRDASARRALQAILSTLDDAGLVGYRGAVQRALQRE